MEMMIANQNKTKEMFQKNIQFLPSGPKNLISGISEEELWEKVKVSYNSDGHPVCRYYENHTWIQITGEKPVREAGQWAENIKVLGSGGIFVFGSGFAYPLFELFEKKQEHTLVIVFEQNLYLFKAMLHYFDFEEMVKTKKLLFMVGDIEDFANAFNHLFFSIVFASCTSPAYAFTHAANRNFKPIYLKIHQYILSQLALYVFYIGNDHLDNLIGFFNLMANTKEIVQNPYISCLKDQYKDVPAFIIANGPSLDKNIRELKKIQGKGLIISTESAIIPLMKNKIKPDILTIIERTKYTYLYHFENVEYPEDMALLCLGLVDQQVFPAFPGQKIPIFRNLEAINQWVNKYLGDGSAIDAGANVSHLAFELAVYMGADPIVFVGQDYAYGPEGVTHSKDSLYLEEKGKLAREILQSMPIVSVESNEGTTIPSNQVWKDFLRGLEQKIASHPDKTILNATEGGAKINGTRCEPLSKVIDAYCTAAPEIQVYEAIAEAKAKISITQRKEGLTNFIESTKAHIDIFRNLSQITITGKLDCMEMIRLCSEKGKETDQGILEKNYVKNIERYQSFIGNDLVRCFSQQVIFAFYYLMNRLGMIDTPEKSKEIFRIQHDFFHHLNLICESVSVHLEDAACFLENTLLDLEKNMERSEAGEPGCGFRKETEAITDGTGQFGDFQ